jgi:hypothetical protein
MPSRSPGPFRQDRLRTDPAGFLKQASDLINRRNDHLQQRLRKVSLKPRLSLVLLSAASAVQPLPWHQLARRHARKLPLYRPSCGSTSSLAEPCGPGSTSARPCGSIARIGQSYHRLSRCLAIAGLSFNQSRDGPDRTDAAVSRVDTMPSRPFAARPARAWSSSRSISAAQVECRRRARTGWPLSRPRRVLTDALSLSSASALRILRASRKISTQDNSST